MSVISPNPGYDPIPGNPSYNSSNNIGEETSLELLKNPLTQAENGNSLEVLLTIDNIDPLNPFVIPPAVFASKKTLLVSESTEFPPAAGNTNTFIAIGGTQQADVAELQRVLFILPKIGDQFEILVSNDSPINKTTQFEVGPDGNRDEVILPGGNIGKLILTVTNITEGAEEISVQFVQWGGLGSFRAVNVIQLVDSAAAAGEPNITAFQLINGLNFTTPLNIFYTNTSGGNQQFNSIAQNPLPTMSDILLALSGVRSGEKISIPIIFSLANTDAVNTVEWMTYADGAGNVVVDPAKFVLVGGTATPVIQAVNTTYMVWFTITNNAPPTGTIDLMRIF